MNIVNFHNPLDLGKVYLIGAGPGDAELLTLKAFKILQQVNVVFYDSLITDEMLALIPKKTKKVFVGKRCGKHSIKQNDICNLLVQAGLSGKIVARLKGGDPSIFGRLAEEADALTQHKIPFAIIPGVTAASGCAAYSGIPLTHRDYSQSVQFITAHQKSVLSEPDWESLSKSQNTLVFYMGLNRIEKISNCLMEHNMSMDMPIAVIDKGATLEQQVLTSTLKDITKALKGLKLLGPALIVVGHVVNARQNIDLNLLFEQHREDYKVNE
ncbi:uroporphyrinogen-III C-methyltransferase [Pseudoalteromonas denitrificans]|uniref:uroporphyrinogen-III C-methyltransferase n=1 Tax=Pseudoalteromonas denitrificans DSM 6059 TaxID=1123010 RepID=A0A1I1U1D0_9GAMM|nr:uroporphyrinogen-III C-methyltransferase [Pseudoalteromonas denitrificans]SFD64569.1 uroporphyrin-III C-methyltransferase [Pseudoalteromonas denitrificans DSM 6059]